MEIRADLVILAGLRQRLTQRFDISGRCAADSEERAAHGAEPEAGVGLRRNGFFPEPRTRAHDSSRQAM